MSSVVGTDLSGTTLDGRYTLIRPLGEGAMGQVYVARHDVLHRAVAVKVLHPWLAAQPKHRERFMREARAASRIEHPNVVEIVDFGTSTGDEVYLVMELLEGQDLKAILRREGPLPWPRARHFLLQAVAALREAHRQGVIHRDIKPANCFVCEPAEPGAPERMKLLDFGIAKLGEDPSASATGTAGKRLTQTGELVGTLAYMAPEFAEGRPASALTDMYALGIMAYELITGNVPFTGRNEFQVLARHLSEPPVRPRVLVPQLPEAVEAVVLTMLAKKPELRFETMADVEQALLAISVDAGEGLTASRGREGSGPLVVRRREGSGPRSQAPPRGRMPRVAVPTPPPLASSPAPVSAPISAPGLASPFASAPTSASASASASAPAPAGPEDTVPPRTSAATVPPADSHAQWTMGDSIDLHGDRPDDEPRPPREWGTIVTIVLLVLLSAAGIASVVLRQQGIELHELRWPWSSPKEAAPDGPEPGPAREAQSAR